MSVTKYYMVETEDGANFDLQTELGLNTTDSKVSVIELSTIPPTACNFTIERPKSGDVVNGHIYLADRALVWFKNGIETAELYSLARNYNILTFQPDPIAYNHPNFAEAKKQIEEMQQKTRRKEQEDRLKKFGPSPELPVSFTFLNDGAWMSGVYNPAFCSPKIQLSNTNYITPQCFIEAYDPVDVHCHKDDKHRLPQELIDYLDSTGGWAE